MSMTRRDYQIVAAALREADAPVDTVASMAHHLAVNYSNFQMATFIAAATKPRIEAQ